MSQQCNQGTGCASRELKYVIVYGLLIVLYLVFLGFVLRLVFVIICKKLARTRRAIFLLFLIILYIINFLIYCSGAFIPQQEQMYFILQLTNFLIFTATILTSLSSWNEIAWRLYFLNNNNIFSFRLLFDLLIIASYVVILISVIILYTQNSFEVNKLRYSFLLIGIFYVFLSVAFAFMYYSVYTSIRLGFSRIFPFYKKRLCITCFFLQAALLMRVCYEFTMLLIVNFKTMTESDSFYIDATMHPICEVLPLAVSLYFFKISTDGQIERTESLLSFMSQQKQSEHINTFQENEETSKRTIRIK